MADPLDQVVADMAEERGSLIDALDELPDRPEWQDLFSPLARVRLSPWPRSCGPCGPTPASPSPT